MSDGTSNNYPRALPYRAPEVAQPSRAAPRVLCYLLAGALGGILVLAGAGALWWWNQTHRASEVVVHPSPRATAWAGPILIEPSIQKTAQAVDTAVTSPQTVTPTVPASTFPRERYLEALGGLTAAHLYQSFLNIGLLADAVENGVQVPADAEKILDTLTGLMMLVDGQLDQIAQTELDADDQGTLRNIRKLGDMLQTQTMALRAYWATDDPNAAAQFQQARTQAWAGISELLGLENPAPSAVTKK